MLANLIYVLALTLVSPIVAYRMLRHGRYRRGIGQKLFGLSRVEAESLLRASAGVLQHELYRDDENEAFDHGCPIWIHAVSVGEVNLLPTLVRRLKRKVPHARIVISSSTDTGYDLARKHFGDDRVFFCPLDFSWAVARTLHSLRPRMLVLTELELWPNLVRLATQAEIPVMVINGRLSPTSSGRYQKFERLTKPIFKQLAWVGCQDEGSQQRFLDCGVEVGRVQVTGSMKFDNALLSKDHPDVHQRSQWAGVDPWHRVWVVGSTQSGEELMALEIYQDLIREFPELRLVIVPRHAQRFDLVASQIEACGLAAHRRSRDVSLDNTTWTNDRVVLVDTIGELKHWWGVCQIATVGGSFGKRGGQNMLEPAGFGAAVSFGPNTKNFAQIADRLLHAGAAVRVHDAVELREFVRRCLSDPPTADSLGRAAREIVQQHRGATDRTVEALLPWLSSSSHQERAA